jgi:hypothetical protein
MKFKNGFVIVEAIQYKRGRALAVFEAFGSKGFNCDDNGRLLYFDPGSEWFLNPREWITRNAQGILKPCKNEWAATPGDWIIKGAEGELSRCEPGIFATTYEPIAE